jgi:hypothetical protein
LFALAGSHLRLRYGLCTYDTNSRLIYVFARNFMHRISAGFYG